VHRVEYYSIAQRKITRIKSSIFLYFLGFECESGMFRPIWSYMPHNSNEYTYDPAADGIMSMNPLMKDPLEEEYLEIYPR
jgi:hypothetical protein